MNLEKEWILPPWVKAGRLDDPGVNPALVLRGFVPDLFHVADCAVGQQTCIDGGEYARRFGVPLVIEAGLRQPCR